jgi:hypothetical protein
VELDVNGDGDQLCDGGFSGEKEKEDEYIPESISSGRGLQKLQLPENVGIAYFAYFAYFKSLSQSLVASGILDFGHQVSLLLKL